MQLTLGVTEAKNRLTGLLRQAEDGKEILITRDNRPAAVLVSAAKYNRMKRQLAVARLRELRQALVGSGLDARDLYEESRRELEGR
jgi:prevent-host-death family protein